MNEYITKSAALTVFGDIHPLDYNTIAYAEKIKAIPAADVVERPRWIPVAERLPEEFSKAVIVYCPKYRNMFLATIRNGKWLSFDTQRSISIEDETVYGEVTHWMPLPEPPKEEA